MESQAKRVFISYKRAVDPDQRLARLFHKLLSEKGHNAFIDTSMRAGDAWLEMIDQELKASDYLVVLLSEAAANSEMVQAEIKRAFEYRRLQGKPNTLPVRIQYKGLLPYSVDAFLDRLQYVSWDHDADDQRVTAEILSAIEGRLPDKKPVKAQTILDGALVDGRIVADDVTLHPPLPEFDPRFLDELEAPGGAVKLRDHFYIEREQDQKLRGEILKSGTTTSIRAARQSGKSSLLVRGIHHARQQGAKIAHLDVQRVDQDNIKSSDAFLRYLAEFIVRKLRLDPAEVARSWQGSLGSQDKLTYLMEDYVLPECDPFIVLAMDEVDRLLHTAFYKDFFALLRSWHNSRAIDPLWDKLNIILAISTEPYLLIPDSSQSPFNVGLKINLVDFDRSQVRDLNALHGSPVRESDFPQFFELFSGHPYLTRKALYTLVTERMGWDSLNASAGEDQGPFGDHLRRYHWLLRNEPDLRTALKEIIRSSRCSNDMTRFRLLRAGLVKGEGDICMCRNDLYRKYFKDKL